MQLNITDIDHSRHIISCVPYNFHLLLIDVCVQFTNHKLYNVIFNLKLDGS